MTIKVKTLLALVGVPVAAWLFTTVIAHGEDIRSLKQLQVQQDRYFERLTTILEKAHGIPTPEPVPTAESRGGGE